MLTTKKVNFQLAVSGDDRLRSALTSARAAMLGMNREIGSTAKLMSLIGPALGAGLFIGLARGAINGLDALNDLKDATGASIENLSALEDIAARTGTKFDTVGTSLVKFNAVLSDSKLGSQAANILKSIGLNAEELKRIDPAEALRKTAVAMAQFADDGGKARAVQELFGKSTREVAPFLADLAKQGQLNATATTEQAEAAEKFNQQLAALDKNLKDASRTLVGDMLPALTQLTSRMAEAKTSSERMAVVFGHLRDNNHFSEIDLQRKSLERLNLSLAATSSLYNNMLAAQASEPYNRAYGQRVTELRTQLDMLRRSAADASEALKAKANLLTGVGAAGGGRGFVNPEIQRPRLDVPELTKRLTRAGSERVNEAERYLESLRKQLEGTKQLTVVAQVLADIEARRIKGIDASTAGKAIDIAEQIDATIARTKLLAEEQRSREAGAQLTERNLQAAAQEAAMLIEGNEALREEIQIISGGEQARRSIERARLSSALALKEDTLAMLQNAGASATEIDLLRQQINLLIQRAQLLGNVGAAADLAKELDKQSANAERFTDILARGAGEAAANFGNLRSVIGSVGQQLLQLTTQLLIVTPAKDFLADLLKPSGGSAGGGFGSALGSIAKSLFGFDSGGFTGNGGAASPAGIVHGQEYVFSAPAVRKLGVGALDLLHAAARNGAELPAYQHGGYVGMPAPAQAPAAERRGDTINVDLRGLTVDSRGQMDRMAEDRAAQRIARTAERYLARRGA